MNVLGYDLPKLKENEEGIIYIPNTREDFGKFQFKIAAYSTLYDEILWLVDNLIQREPEPFYILKIERPAIAYLLKYGVYKMIGQEISRTKSRQLSRFLKGMFAIMHTNYISQNIQEGDV